MRISDWSSDVCSSDLDERVDAVGRSRLEQRDALGLGQASGHLDGGVEVGRHVGLAVEVEGEGPDELGNDVELALAQRRDVGLARTELELQIGRASCRERVCQYV